MPWIEPQRLHETLDEFRLWQQSYFKELLPLQNLTVKRRELLIPGLMETFHLQSDLSLMRNIRVIFFELSRLSWQYYSIFSRPRNTSCSTSVSHARPWNSFDATVIA
jgi:hypothetical protein